MENQNAALATENAEEVPPVTEEVPPVTEQPQYFDVNDTAIVEYLDVVKTEYAIERNKKQSFESRAGLIMAMLGAISIFLFEKVRLKDVFLSMHMTMTFLVLIKIFSGLLVYGSFIFTMFMIIKTITVGEYENFEVKNIDETLLGEQRLTALCRIIFVYQEIIIKHRSKNKPRADAYKNSLYGIFVNLISLIIYIALT